MDNEWGNWHDRMKKMTICRVFRKKVVTLQAESLRW